MKLYSLFHRELSVLSGKKHFYLKRMAILIVIGLGFLIIFTSSHRGSTVGLSLYSNMAYFLLISLIILAPSKQKMVINHVIFLIPSRAFYTAQ